MSFAAGFAFPLDVRLSFLACCLALTVSPAFAAVASARCSASGNLAMASSSTPKSSDVPASWATSLISRRAWLRGRWLNDPCRFSRRCFDEGFQVLRMRTRSRIRRPPVAAVPDLRVKPLEKPFALGIMCGTFGGR